MSLYIFAFAFLFYSLGESSECMFWSDVQMYLSGQCSGFSMLYVSTSSTTNFTDFMNCNIYGVVVA